MNSTPDSLTADAKAEHLESWALVEIFGHDKLAGLVTTRKFGTEMMFQIDVPKPDGEGFAYSRLLSPKAVFAIQPTNEDWCRRWAKAASEYDRSPLPYIPEPAKLAPAEEPGDDDEYSLTDKGVEVAEWLREERRREEEGLPT